MNRLNGLVIAGLVLMVGVTPSWGGPPNPTTSDANDNTAGGSGAVEAVTLGFANTGFGAAALSSNTTGAYNTATGASALATNTDGSFNTATGAHALENNVSGINNTATGHMALIHNTDGQQNTATGTLALYSNQLGHNNTATGVDALVFNTTGSENTAAGVSALAWNRTGVNNSAYGSGALHNGGGDRNTALGARALSYSRGNGNVAIGEGAGVALVIGNKNIYLGHSGVASESKTMRLGSAQTKTFIAGVTTAAVTGTNVVINASGQLGVPLSSARYKRDIETMGARSAGLLKLRPVTFAYTHDGPGVRQYGLIAEEVATVYPELVTHTATGEVQAVRYQELIPMLVNELQRQQHVTEHLQRELAELRSLVGQMRGGVAQR